MYSLGNCKINARNFFVASEYVFNIFMALGNVFYLCYGVRKIDFNIFMAF